MLNCRIQSPPATQPLVVKQARIGPELEFVDDFGTTWWVAHEERGQHIPATRFEPRELPEIVLTHLRLGNTPIPLTDVSIAFREALYTHIEDHLEDARHG